MKLLRLDSRNWCANHRLWMLAVAGVIAGCATPPRPPVAVIPPPAPVVVALPPAVVKAAEPIEEPPRLVSNASTAKDYRRDAAAHLYQRMQDRVYKGKMPALLHAVGVLQVDIDRRGAVTDLRWMRAPQHAPEVMAEIERSVRSAAPYPAPTRMGGVTYTDTWVWHKTGRFQLDTLSEGQL